MVLVVGDAGVGKTRFAGEGMTRAAAAGMVVARGDCLRVSRTLPLLPVVAAVGELGRLEGGGLLAAALDAVPGFVRRELGRLMPALGPGGGGSTGRDEGWERERLFSAVAELLDAVAGRSAAGVGLVVEDVHWADSETLDCLTFLARSAHAGGVRVVVTCRGDEAPLDPDVSGWLADVRGAAGVEEIRLGPLSRAEVAEQAAALAGGPVPSPVVDELYARAEGNPFFTEQLVAAALVSAADGGLQDPAGLPVRLAELLVARADRCAGDARVVLEALAVAGRPLLEDLLGEITGLERERVRGALRELAAARLLAEDTKGGHRPRHALLAEAVAAGMLPGERTTAHERTARAMAGIGDQALAAEVALHWQCAGRPAEELPARVAAALAAEQVFGYAEAAAQWQRAVELCQVQPGAVRTAGVDVPRLYVRAIDALFRSGDGVRAGVVAEEAHRRFAGHPDPATAALVCHRAAYFRAVDAPAAGLPLIEEALRLFGQAPPSADHAEALLDYARTFLIPLYGEDDATRPALDRALEIAEAADATALIPRVLAGLADDAFSREQVEEGFAFLQRGWVLAHASEDGPALAWLAIAESDALFRLAQFQPATQVALRSLEVARQAGLGNWYAVTTLAANASEAFLAVGHMAEAAALIGPLTAGLPDHDHWLAHECRAEIDLLRGDISAAAGRRQLIDAFPARISSLEFARESAQRAAELALWARRPADALDGVQAALARLKDPGLTVIFCGRLLGAGMRACADLAEQARARLDQPAVVAAMTAADGLVSWVGQMAGAPFTDHRFVATIPAERATWDAERTRLNGRSDSAAWGAVVAIWNDLGCPHRAGYASWRQAQAQLDAGQPTTVAAAALQTAAVAAEGHEPLLAQIRTLAQRARIPLQARPAARKPAPAAAAPYGLTERELAVLRLVGPAAPTRRSAPNCT